MPPQTHEIISLKPDEWDAKRYNIRIAWRAKARERLTTDATYYGIDYDNFKAWTENHSWWLANTLDGISVLIQ